jgi:hypothetical protein
VCCVLCPTLVLRLHIFLLLSPFKAGSSAGGKERGTWSGEDSRGVVIVIVPSSNGPICPPCRSCPGCTRAASCRLTHGPGRTDIQTDKMPRRFYTTVHVGVSFPFLSFPSSCHFTQSFLLMALQLTLCLHLQSVRQNLQLSAKVAPLCSV